MSPMPCRRALRTRRRPKFLLRVVAVSGLHLAPALQAQYHRILALTVFVDGRMELRQTLQAGELVKADSAPSTCGPTASGFCPKEQETASAWTATKWSETRRGWVFITSRSALFAALRPLISLWIDLLVLRLLNESDPGQKRVWFAQTTNRST